MAQGAQAASSPGELKLRLTGQLGQERKPCGHRQEGTKGCGHSPQHTEGSAFRDPAAPAPASQVGRMAFIAFAGGASCSTGFIDKVTETTLHPMRHVRTAPQRSLLAPDFVKGASARTPVP